jgi:hypothetical protein
MLFEISDILWDGRECLIFPTLKTLHHVRIYKNVSCDLLMVLFASSHAIHRIKLGRNDELLVYSVRQRNKSQNLKNQTQSLSSADPSSWATLKVLEPRIAKNASLMFDESLGQTTMFISEFSIVEEDILGISYSKEKLNLNKNIDVYDLNVVIGNTKFFELYQSMELYDEEEYKFLMDLVKKCEKVKYKSRKTRLTNECSSSGAQTNSCTRYHALTISACLYVQKTNICSSFSRYQLTDAHESTAAQILRQSGIN